MHKFLSHNYLLPTAFADYFALNKFVHKYDTQTRDDLHVISVNKGIGKRSVRYKGCTLWNALPDNVKGYLSVKNFKSQLMNYLLLST